MAVKYSPCSSLTPNAEPPQTIRFPEPQKDEKHAKIVFCVLVFVNLILLVLIGLLSSAIFKESVTPIPVKRFCVPRSHIDMHPYDRADLASCDRTQCCFHNLNESAKILLNMTSRWLKEKIAYDDKRKYERYECVGVNSTSNSNIGHAIKTTIKLVAREKRSAPCENVLWNCSSEREIIPSSDPYYRVKEDKGFIEILVPGLYHVYTQINIHYNTNDTTTRSTAPVDYYHMVISRQNIADTKNEQILMRNTNSQCTCDNNTQLFSSYLGSDLLLRRGENIAVRVYENTVLQMPPESNFFGILKV